MKRTLSLFSIVLTLVAVLAWTFTIAQPGKRAGVASFSPTPSPIRTPGPETLGVRTVPIVKITSEDQLLGKLLVEGGARWENPWSLETRTTDPDRIRIKRYPDSSIIGEEYAKENHSAVWVVAIKGKARVGLPGWEGVSDGVTYYYNEDTGDMIQTAGKFIDPK